MGKIAGCRACRITGPIWARIHHEGTSAFMLTPTRAWILKLLPAGAQEEYVRRFGVPSSV